VPGVGSFLYATIDCLDPASMASFWAHVLDTEVDLSMDEGRYVFLKGRSDLPVLCFQRVPERKGAKNRIHLDLAVDDLEVATARVLELGGSWPDGTERRLDAFTWRTLADPEGNEFDVATGA
jgi:predicted enzyme related to lactoylglutathione lyase